MTDIEAEWYTIYAMRLAPALIAFTVAAWAVS